MFKGTLYVTNDINVVQTVMVSNRIIIVGEPDAAFVQSTGAVVGSVLLPPYNAMIARMDNDMNSFSQLYNDYLLQKEPSTFITVILRALYNGTNIVLYCPSDEFTLYFEELYKHMIYNYGIYIGTISSPFNFDPSFAGKICAMMYFYDLFNVQELFIAYPKGVDIPDDIVMKLIGDLNPYVQDITLNGYKQYFFELKERVKIKNTFLSPIMQRC
ncbi:MAG: hypothetical protein ACRDD7_14640 [Peptostreptococcaceae bacterium]